MLALLFVLMTLGAVALTVARPNVIKEVQHDQEEELIFRGESIARAIRMHKALTGRYPTSLEELVKLRPRIIRRLYKDPMTREGEWAVVTAVQPGASGDTRGLPIVGVRTRAQLDSMKIYRQKTLTSDWIFSAADDLLGMPGSSLPTAQGSQPSGHGSQGGDVREVPQAQGDAPKP